MYILADFSCPNNMPVEVLITIYAHPRLQRRESRNRNDQKAGKTGKRLQRQEQSLCRYIVLAQRCTLRQ
jgi:hypothetical protein